MSHLIERARVDLATAQDILGGLPEIEEKIRSAGELTDENIAKLATVKSMAQESVQKLTSDIERWSGALAPLIPYLAE